MLQIQEALGSNQTEVFHGFPEFLQETAWILFKSRPQQLPSASVAIIQSSCDSTTSTTPIFNILQLAI
jgi:hypothetical protein